MCKALEEGPPVTHLDRDGMPKMAAPQWPQGKVAMLEGGKPGSSEGGGEQGWGAGAGRAGGGGGMEIGLLWLVGRPALSWAHP